MHDLNPESSKRFLSARVNDPGLISQSMPRLPSGPVRVAARLKGFSKSITVTRIISWLDSHVFRVAARSV
jgi:hypothetical protein